VPPGTSGIKPGKVKMITGVLKLRAKIWLANAMKKEAIIVAKKSTAPK